MMRRILIAGLGALGLAFLFVKFGPLEVRRKAVAVRAWMLEDTAGCSFAACLSEIGPALSDSMERIRRQSSLVRTDGIYELWATPLGEFWSPRGNSLFFDLAEQSIDIYSEGAEVRPGDVVLDCGANIGTFTRQALNKGAAKVIAFDIDPRNLESLRRTFAREIEGGRVVVVSKGVWDREDVLEANFYDNTNLNSVAMRERTETAQKPLRAAVPLARIDTVVQELGLATVDFIKMDVEGAEPKALAGARETIRRFRPRLSIATENEPGDVFDVPRIVRTFGLSYKELPGACRRVRAGVMRPEVYFFY
ncbi:MAG: FkbM family methyltransferase [Bryobacteraceae bacterium]|nr:FkbM family methyltransferase [Bryobacteraceae bacterium]